MSEGKEEGFYKSEKEERIKEVLFYNKNNQFVHLAINKGSTRKNEEDLVLRGRFGISGLVLKNKFKDFLFRFILSRVSSTTLEDALGCLKMF